MRGMLLLLSAFFLLCSKYDETLSVVIEHNRSNPHSLNDEIQFSNQTHLRLEITDRPMEDASSTRIYLFDYKNIASLPFTVNLSKKNDLAQLNEHSEYLIHAELLQGSDSTAYIGDLISE